MSEPDASKPSPLFGERAARQLGVALLASVAAVVAFTWCDAGTVNQRERFEEVTGVGDQQFFAIAANAAPGMVIAEGQGHSWKLAETTKRELHDVRMVRAGRDEARGVTLYRRRVEAKADELFVKVEPNGYLLLVP